MQSPGHIGPGIRGCVVVSIALGMCGAAGIAVADSSEQQILVEATPTSAIEEALAALPFAPKDLAADATALCGDKPGGPVWIDRMRAGLYKTICLSAARFDGFFGNARFDDQYEATHGSIAVGTQWDERDHWDPSLRFRASVRLPQLSDRFSAFIGRLDADEYVTEARDDFDTLPRQFARETDDAVLVGLGYRQSGRQGGYFDASAGASFGWPIEPYVKGGYHLAHPFFERNLLRLNETVFWKEDERLGTTTRVDLERLLTDDFLVRWTGSGTFSQETEGVRWYSTATLYQSLGKGRALAYQAAISGETDHEVAITDYGARVIFRRQVYREWLFLELRTSLTWPRESLIEEREPNWGAGAAIEMQFGGRD